MNLHEYQAKQILKDYGLPVPIGKVVQSEQDAAAIKSEIGGDKWVVKAQVHAGGRGKAGGVKLCQSQEEVAAAVNQLLGTRLVTYQTDDKGQPINQLLIEMATDIKTELYFGAVIDRTSERVVFMASTEGGVDIEKVANETPEKILTVDIDPLLGAQPYQARKLGYQLGLNDQQIKQLTSIFLQLATLFVEKDLALLEINPLVINQNDELICLDAKMNVDGNAGFRQRELEAIYDTSQDDDRERRASEWDLSYVALDGTIGCMVNGAGLAMATMDIIKLYGGSPANFLDVGGGATKERVAEAFKIILDDDSVQAVLINIFGGIVRCDLIADGIISAVAEEGIDVPVVVRLEGNNAKLGAEKLDASELNIISASSLADAAQQVVKLVQA